MMDHLGKLGMAHGRKSTAAHNEAESRKRVKNPSVANPDSARAAYFPFEMQLARL